MIYDVLYSVFLDGKFIGFTDDEDYAWEIAQDYLNGYDVLYDDDYPDRVWCHKIDINRWYYYDNYNCSDKLSDDNIYCYNDRATDKCVKIMNKQNREIERAKAKLRALLL